MRITDFVIRNLNVPLKHLYSLSKAYGVQTGGSVIVIEIHTDEGITGWGECNPWPAFTGDTDMSVIALLEKLLCPALIGFDPTNINAVHVFMDKLLRSNSTAKAGIDMACYDILGKFSHLPVHKLIGGKIRDTVKCFWAVGGNSPEETAAEVIKIKDEGYYGCMIKVGNDWKYDAARTLAVREAVGADFPLIADANQGWDVDTAIAYGKAVKNANLLFFEQPVKYYDIDGLAKIRKHVPMPVSADEGVSTIHDAHALIKANACDYFSIKSSKMGGIKPTLDICEFANEHGIKLFFNSMLEEGITQVSSLHVSSVVPNIMETTGHSFFSTLRLQGDISDFYTFIQNGEARVPDKPGLGIEIDHHTMDMFTIGRYEIK